MLIGIQDDDFVTLLTPEGATKEDLRLPAELEFRDVSNLETHESNHDLDGGSIEERPFKRKRPAAYRSESNGQ